MHVVLINFLMCCSWAKSILNQSHVFYYWLLLDRNNFKHNYVRVKLNNALKQDYIPTQSLPIILHPATDARITGITSASSPSNTLYTAQNKKKPLILDVILALWICCFCNCQWKRYTANHFFFFISKVVDYMYRAHYMFSVSYASQSSNMQGSSIETPTKYMFEIIFLD